MKIKKLFIKNFRSIEDVELSFPEGKPLVLFGPNNAGKSNIIAALHRFLGDRAPEDLEMENNDWFMRDKESGAPCRIGCQFDAPYIKGNDAVFVSYKPKTSKGQLEDVNGKRLTDSKGERECIQSFLLGAERDISKQFSYSSRYTLLSKFSHAMHKSINPEGKDRLSEAFETIKDVFCNVPAYSVFGEDFSNTVSDSVEGFSHSLDVDFSAYDAANYANALRIVAKEGDALRDFDEFGTGEQQIMLMAFAKAYMKAFGSESIVLILEEPEAHLHPLAQRWLKDYIYELCCEGMQIVISTHSPDFLDPSNLEGLVRVSKDERGVTKITQLMREELVQQCIDNGVPNDKISADGVGEFYAAKLTPDSLKGLFAKTVLLVEGATEYFTLPVYLQRAGCSLARQSIEIVNCGGKKASSGFARLFAAFNIRVFCLFDADEGTKEMEKIPTKISRTISI